MRARWALALTSTLAVLGAALGGAAAASATAPVRLGSSYVLDDAGVLSPADAQDVESRLTDLAQDSDVELWVTFVDEFTNPADAAEWANATAQVNGLGVDQYLLAVAVDTRQYYLSGDEAGPVSFDELGEIETSRIQPELRDGDYAGAVIAAADGLDAAAGGGGGSGTWILVAVVVILAVVIIVWAVRRRRKPAGARAGTSAPQPSLEELERQSGSALVQTDDAIKASEQELGFARAEFGDAAVEEFAQVLAHAKADLDRAFSLQQKLDDSTPDTEEQVRQWRGEIITLCAAANEALDAKAAAFDVLRDLERNAPQELERVRGERARVADAIAATETALASLRAQYADEALATVADNPAQARERIAFADAQLAEAQSDLDEGRTGEAALGIRAAQDAVAQARLLEEAVTHVSTDLAAADTRAGAVAAEIESDIAAAAAVPDPDGRIAAAVDAAREQLRVAREALGGERRRPLEALTGLEQANTTLDTVVAAGRDAAAQQRRAAAQLDQALLQARAQVTAGNDFIAARRGAVGATARTRLAEAGALLDQAEALRGTDAAAALAAAQRATQLGSEAIRLARNDVSAYAAPTGGYGTGYGRGGSGAGDVLMGAMLGGLLAGGGGRRSSGFGGGFSGGSRGGFSAGSRSRAGGSSGGGRARRGGGRF